jgi:hypothetical protein
MAENPMKIVARSDNASRGVAFAMDTMSAFGDTLNSKAAFSGVSAHNRRNIWIVGFFIDGHGLRPIHGGQTCRFGELSLRHG